MNGQPLVSVIMNCYNSGKYLKEAIESIFSQTYGKWEIIFWDNASTDNSAKIAKSYERLRYFRSEENVTLGKARNWAIEKARGEYIAFLDCDDIWLPEKLEKQTYILENRPDIEFIYSNYFRIIMPRSDRLILALKRKQPEGNVFEHFLYHYPVNMQTVMLRKAVLDRLDSLFDETLNLSEEYDLFMRILYDAKAAYLQEPMVIYRVHSDMSSIRYMDRYPNEIAYILEKLKRMDHLLEKKYSSAFRYADAKIGYWRAKTEMERENQQAARVHLAKYRFVSLKFYMLYLIMYLPRLWKKVHVLKENGTFR